MQGLVTAREKPPAQEQWKTGKNNAKKQVETMKIVAVMQP
jgi:hypothetical protein